MNSVHSFRINFILCANIRRQPDGVRLNFMSIAQNEQSFSLTNFLRRKNKKTLLFRGIYSTFNTILQVCCLHNSIRRHATMKLNVKCDREWEQKITIDNTTVIVCIWCHKFVWNHWQKKTSYLCAVHICLFKVSGRIQNRNYISCNWKKRARTICNAWPLYAIMFTFSSLNAKQRHSYWYRRAQCLCLSCSLSVYVFVSMK